ncbi:MAG: phytanoyl-CoA dioxygenase family protein [Abditibacteriaceae bacterium]
MSFQFSEAHIESFQTQGYTIFRGVLPPTLIDDLRVVCEKGSTAVKQADAQSQRFGLAALDATDLKPFENYRDLPELQDAMQRVLGSGVKHGDFGHSSVLVEPGELPYCTQWHRDWRDNVPGLDLEKFERVKSDIALFNQVNCALYEDSCTWIVPGSQNRRDTSEEVTRFPVRPIDGPTIDGLSYAQRERVCFEYCQSMPDAMQAVLNAGDFMLYRSVMWHIGNYLPYKKRATIHEGVMTPQFTQYWDEAASQSAERNKNGAIWENPNDPSRQLSATSA